MTAIPVPKRDPAQTVIDAVLRALESEGDEPRDLTPVECAALIEAMLCVRQDEVLTRALARERAASIAAALTGRTVLP